MTIWVLHQQLSADEQARITTRTQLQLPFNGLPDLTQATSLVKCRQLLLLLHPNEPPEALARQAERIWAIHGTLSKEDIIAVPLPATEEVALAEVSGPYHYELDSNRADVHLIPVTWYEPRISLRLKRKLRDLFKPDGAPMFEVTRPEERIAIRDYLPHSYNRFAKWKWLLGVFFLLGLFRLYRQMQGM